MSDEFLNVQLLISGKWQDAADGRTLPVHDPATGETIGKIAHASKTDLALAAEGAAKGFEAWRTLTAWDRFVIMRRAANLLRERAESIARIMSREQGKPLAQALAEIDGAAGVIEYFGEEGRRLNDVLVPPRVANVEQRVLHRPVGVVAAFTPWNFPINQIARKLGAALGAGCAVIVKAPEDTPASPAELLRVFLDAGIPAGAVSLVYGDPAEISEYLIAHPVVRKISFTGSTPVGKHLASLAGAQMKPVTMELGGHAPVIVCADADLDAAAERLAAAKFRNAGQVCIAPTRFLLEQSIAPTFVDKFKARMSALKIGRGVDDGVTMGPLVNSRRVKALQELVEDARANGATVWHPDTALPNGGCFFPPTLIQNPDLSMRVMQEEPFGPLAIVSEFTSLTDAVKEANRLPYGLAAYVYTRNERTQRLLGEQVEAGMVAVNHHGIGVPEVPFGGIKDSGYGTEGGPEALRAHTYIKLVSSEQAKADF
ncbi:NAD-dependent succinate-semialdehyde dehydrogenase [Acetobacter cibinongensis]|uniref:Aldehyde/succinate-semialdehyde dehydrogenase n=1 Tax=Acetobacter cibinongensis TaxID=146475 RepID=A0A0D6N185_9PROT|nr:NAD-dependent succinate-semialdehyde dehydrogenase [Acetobacter cibinongensis]GAN59313.1 aldehyde/succinate-semialdehyde dehydrogenase [Acetobacter cibinongensis]GEL59062.1 NAD-dependent succinate-semialdehyde dehydrogenase [Acetobacter cibinongensis]